MAILDRFKLDGKVAVVTGCRRGIGKALAVALGGSRRRYCGRQQITRTDRQRRGESRSRKRAASSAPTNVTFATARQFMNSPPA